MDFTLIIRRDRLTEGLVAVLCVRKTCKTVRLGDEFLPAEKAFFKREGIPFFF